jgi:hypothetical protein
VPTSELRNIVKTAVRSVVGQVFAEPNDQKTRKSAEIGVSIALRKLLTAETPRPTICRYMSEVPDSLNTPEIIDKGLIRGVVTFHCSSGVKTEYRWEIGPGAGPIEVHVYDEQVTEPRICSHCHTHLNDEPRPVLDLKSGDAIAKVYVCEDCGRVYGE